MDEEDVEELEAALSEEPPVEDVVFEPEPESDDPELLPGSEEVLLERESLR